MPERGLGNEVQARAVLEQVADAAVAKFALEYPDKLKAGEPVKAELPPAVKWGATLISALLTTGIAALVFWLVSSVGEMQVTLGRMDERMQQDVAGQRITENQRRIEKLEERLGRIEEGKGRS